MLDRTILLYLLVVVSAVVLNLMALFDWNLTNVTNDGVQYLSTAENWLNGKGFSTNALMYDPHFQGDFPGPQTVWPPGYPFALAMLGILGVKLTTAGLILNLLFHAFASVLIVLILKRMRVDTQYAVICALLFYTMAMPWDFALGIATEPMFTSLILAAILFLPVLGRSNISTWLLCGALLACCIYVRYSTVFHAAGVGIGILCFLFFYCHKDWKTLLSGGWRLAALTVIPVLAFLQLMYRTNVLTGTIDRNAGTRVPETAYFTIRQWAAQSADLLGFSEGGIYSNDVGILLFLCTLALIFSLVIYANFVYRQDNDQDENSDHARYTRLAGFVITAHAVLLLAYLTYCTLTSSPLEILSRYLYQVYPGIYVLFCALMYGLIHRVKHAVTGCIPTILKNSLVALVVMYALAQVNEATSTNLFIAEGQTAQKMLALPVTDEIDLASYIESCIANDERGSVWSTHGQHLHFHTGIPTLTLAEIYTNVPPDFIKIQRQIEIYNVKLMVFRNDELNLNVEYKQHLQEIKEWLVGNGHNAVTLQNNVVDSHTTVDVFQVNQQCG